MTWSFLTIGVAVKRPEALTRPTYASKGNVRYRYYVCLKATKRGWNTCQSKSVPAQQIEQFVIERIRAVSKTADDRLVADAQAFEDLRSFGAGWDKLPPKEQAKILWRLVERVDYGGDKGTIAITFRSDGIGPKAKTKDKAA
jgi:acyl-CoA reductase-like NAD-dependent aldehyde dehydrogenase